MSTTLEQLEAQNKIVAVRGEIGIVAAALDSLGAYEQAATSCATAMNADGGMAEAVVAALSSADVAAAARAVITRGGGEDSRLERELTEAAITACKRSERQCAPHADHHDHCRLHAATARDTIAALKSLLAALS
jgi:hypothetical protein